MGAIAYLQKPTDKKALDAAFARICSFVERQVKKLLVVEDDEAQRKAIAELIGNSDVEITAVATGSEALEQLKTTHFDCMVLDLSLPDTTGVELIGKLQKELGLRSLPIVVRVRPRCRTPISTAVMAMMSRLCGNRDTPPREMMPLPKKVGNVSGYGPQIRTASAAMLTETPMVAVTVVRKCFPSSGRKTTRWKT